MPFVGIAFQNWRMGMMPALLPITSSLPWSLTVELTTALTCSFFVTSQAQAWALPPALTSSLTGALSLSFRRAASETTAPRAAKYRGVAAPMPR
jgi:hypothetical protein